MPYALFTWIDSHVFTGYSYFSNILQDVVTTKMNDVYDASSDVIDPNPKKSKNPLKKLIRKMFKKKKNGAEEQLNDGETTVGTTKGGAKSRMKRVKSKRSNTETKSAKHARSATRAPMISSVSLQEEGTPSRGHLRSQSGRQVATKGLGRTRSRWVRVGVRVRVIEEVQK